MAKAFLSKDTAERIRAARAGSTEKPAEKLVSANNASTPPTYTAPIPIPKAATITPSSSPAPSPPIQQVIIYPPVDNSTLLKEKADKEKAQQLYEAEKVARAKSQEQHKEQLQAIARDKAQVEQLRQEELARYQQLIKDDDSLKRKHNLALEKVKADEETIRRITQEKEALKQELERLKKSHEEKTIAPETSEEEGDTKVESGVPLVPDYEEPHPAESIASITTNNDVQLVGDIAPESPIVGGENDKCVVS